MPKQYTKLELAVMNAWYPTHGTKKIAKVLGRSRSGIRNLAYRNGIACVYPRTKCVCSPTGVPK